MKLLRPLLVSVIALVALTTAAGAFPLRTPQVGFASGLLQGYLNAWDGGITVTTDQLDAQVFSTGITGNTDFTLALNTAGGTAIGVYNTLEGPTPVLYQLFPSAATAGWSVACHFTPTGVLQVALFDELFSLQGTMSYAGVDRTHFGFYISAVVPDLTYNQASTGTWYSQDVRNGNKPQVLTYMGTGANFGEWFECFETAPYDPGSSTFTGAVLVLQSVAPVPALSTSWGSLKGLYK